MICGRTKAYSETKLLLTDNASRPTSLSVAAPHRQGRMLSPSQAGGAVCHRDGTGEPHTTRQGRLETHSWDCHTASVPGTTGTTHQAIQSRVWFPPTIMRALTSTSLPRTKNWMLNGPEMAKAFAIFFVAAFTYKKQYVCCYYIWNKILQNSPTSINHLMCIPLNPISLL